MKKVHHLWIQILHAAAPFKLIKFKLIHRIVITRKELFKFGIKTDDECLYCGDMDSIDHTFIECPYTASFAKKVIQLMV